MYVYICIYIYVYIYIYIYIYIYQVNPDTNSAMTVPPQVDLSPFSSRRDSTQSSADLLSMELAIYMYTYIFTHTHTRTHTRTHIYIYIYIYIYIFIYIYTYVLTDGVWRQVDLSPFSSRRDSTQSSADLLSVELAAMAPVVGAGEPR